MQSWFDVDKDGLKEMFANYGNERLLLELVQNALDENAGTCSVQIRNIDQETVVDVADDNPDGFKDIRDAYTLFRSTGKRADPTVRGKFNLGDKIVLARARRGVITTTKGKVVFDKTGRRSVSTKREFGSVISVAFDKWNKGEIERVEKFLAKIYPPKNSVLVVNGKPVPYRKPRFKASTKLLTEYLRPNGAGNMVMTKTQRKTTVWFYSKAGTKAFLYEMGLPVCEIEGRFDVNVQQKVPLSHDRTLVPQAYLQDIYAEMVMVLQDELTPQDLEDAPYLRMALEDDRVDAATSASIFRKIYGNKAVLQSHDPDSDQEAVRDGAMMVSSRTYGSSINTKLREGGVHTSKELYCRDRTELEREGNMPAGFREVKHNPAREKFRRYAAALTQKLYDKTLEIKFAVWPGNTTAFYERDQAVTFNMRNILKTQLDTPVSSLTSLILHEIAHAQGEGHDSVYDEEFERLVNKHTKLVLVEPQFYLEFEPSLVK